MSENEVTDIGGKVGPRIAKLVSDAVAHTQTKLGDHKNGLAQQILADFTNHVSDEVRQMFGGILKELAEHPDMTPRLRNTFTTLATERGQAFGWVAGSAMGTAASAGLFDLINNWLAPVVHALIAETPNKFLTPDIVAQAVARGIDYGGAPRSIHYDAAGGGINAVRLGVLTKLAFAHPTANQTQELVNRGTWTAEQGEENLRLLGVPRDETEAMLSLRRMLLSPDILATMVNRDVLTDSQGRSRASQAGMSGDDFNRMIEIYGEPLSPTALGEAFRRGMIDRERFERGVIQGPLRKEWFDVLEALQFSRMSTVDAADGVNQGHLTLEAAQEISTANGLDPADFETLIKLAGSPPGVDFITEALNRELIDEATFTEAFLESRVKNKYVDLFMQMRTRLIPQETVRLLYRHGVYSREDTLRTLRFHGFSEEDAEVLIALEEVRQDTTTRELTRSQIVDMYEERTLSLPDALALLLALGYSEGNARAMIELADVKRINAFVRAAITRLRASYVSGRISEVDVSAQLDLLGVPSDQRDDMMAIWDIDRTTITKDLTPTQLRQAVNKALMDTETAVARLMGQGYDEMDARLFLQLTA